MEYPAIGIDLGTTNSLVTVFEHNGPRLIKNALGSVLTPSAVSLLNDGIIVTGQAAKDRLISHPQSSIASFKRFMGTKRSSLLNGKTFSPVELSALILRALKRDAETDLGVPCPHAVVSVPAYFNDIQRKATLAAATLAGFKVERLINEPTAAALAYGLTDAEEGNFLVFDLGGGTFDVSILDKFAGVLEVKATTGDPRLGGDDFTNLIIELISQRLRLDHDALPPLDIAKFSVEAERLKVALTREQSVNYEFMLSSQLIKGTITRTQFEDAAATLLRRLRLPTERAVRDSELAPDEFSAVVLVGGATRMPMVRSLVAKMFGRLPLINIDPDTTVALGAAVQAGLVGRHAALEELMMTDVCPFTLGVRVKDSDHKDALPYIDPIIERNAAVPVSREVSLTTMQHNQIEISVQVYQGENFRPENNTLLGELLVKIPKGPKGTEYVAVRYTYDINGILEVEVRVESTGVVLKKYFNSPDGKSEKELAESFRKLEDLKVQPRAQAENQALLSRADRIYEEAKGPLRDVVKQSILQFESEILNQQVRKPEKLRDAFAKQLNELETSLSYLD
jgi:molecular chaperone HscC